MQNFAFYHHGGSENRGCEALVRSTSAMLKGRFPDCGEIHLYSQRPSNDFQSNYENVDVIYSSSFEDVNLKPVISFTDKVRLKLSRMQSPFKADEYLYSMYLKNTNLHEEDVCLSIGGDNYCYGDCTWMQAFNLYLKKHNKRTVLWGCSLDESSFSDYNIQGLRTFDAIFARESGSFELLESKGFHKNVFLHPDPAFTLATKCLPLPDGFQVDNTIGINASPLVFKYEQGGQKGVGMRSYIRLIEYILEKTDSSVLLIPHVFWDASDDRTVLTELYNQFKDSGRVILLTEKYSSTELKGFISRCRAFIGARTHSTIAAYSTGVPTLVLGYSSKSVNIATDLFGDTEGFVVPIDRLSDEHGLANAFAEMIRNENVHKQKLAEVIPPYVERAYMAVDTLVKFLSE